MAIIDHAATLYGRLGHSETCITQFLSSVFEKLVEVCIGRNIQSRDELFGDSELFCFCCYVSVPLRNLLCLLHSSSLFLTNCLEQVNLECLHIERRCGFIIFILPAPIGSMLLFQLLHLHLKR